MTRMIKSEDVNGREIVTEELFTVPLGLSFGTDDSYDTEEHAIEVMKSSLVEDCLIPGGISRNVKHMVLQLVIYIVHIAKDNVIGMEHRIQNILVRTLRGQH
jgi:hypothetical protein